MMHGDIGRAALEVRHWVTAPKHQLSDEAISLAHDTGRIVDEARLQVLPVLGESRRFGRRQRDELQSLHASLPRAELGLRLVPITDGMHYALVFGSKSLLQMSRASSL